MGIRNGGKRRKRRIHGMGGERTSRVKGAHSWSFAREGEEKSIAR